MKRFIAVILGLAMVLVLAGAASAFDLKVTGFIRTDVDYESGSWEYNWDYSGYVPAEYQIYLTLSEQFGNAKADLIYGHFGEDYQEIGLLESNITYKFGDFFTLGLKVEGYNDAATYYVDDDYLGHTTYFTPAVFSESDYELAMYNHLDYEEVFLTAAADLGEGAINIYYELYESGPDIYLGGSYDFGSVKVGGGLWHQSDVQLLDVYAKYALSDELTLAAEYLDNSYEGYTSVAVQAAYQTDALEAKATVYYDPDTSDLYDYTVEGAYKLNEVVSVKGRYSNDDGDEDNYYQENSTDGFSVGVVCEFAPQLTVESNYYFTSVNRLEFKATYTF